MISLVQIAQVLGGEVSGRQVLAPAPGHSPADRGMSVRLDGPDGLLVHLFNGGDDLAAKDYVRSKIGAEPWKPRRGKLNGHGRRHDDEIDEILAGPASTSSIPPPASSAPLKWVCDYDYRGLDGSLIYQVRRFAPKTFKQRRPDGRGGWITTKVFEGISRVPYHWPELAAEMASYPDAPVFCTEGEKDADNVRALGLSATCAAGNVWTPEIATALAGRDIILLCDNDAPGRDKATKAATVLRACARSVRIASFPELPAKADVSDWLALDGNNNSDALINHCRTAPLFDPKAAEAPAADDVALGEWDAGDDTTEIPPRGWLLGNAFCRRFISSVIAEGGTGKSALRLAQLLSLAIGRPLTGEHVFARCRVLIVSLEDNADELRRRVRAACLHHGVSQADLKGWLYLAAPGLAGGKLVTLDPHGRPVAGALAAKLKRTIAARQIDIASLDPFVKAHSVEENNNSMIDEVVQVLAGLADQHDMAIDVPHHAAKGAADPGNANRGRGASSMKDAGRLVYTLTPMAPEEAQGFGLSEADRRRLIRLDSAKVNIAPSMADAKWFRLVGVDIGNGTEPYPSGDQVQTVEPWEPPATFAGLGNLMVNEILNIISAGLPDGRRYSNASAAKDTAAWRVIAAICSGKPEAICRKIIGLWLASGLLMNEKYLNPVNRKEENGLRVDDRKRPS